MGCIGFCILNHISIYDGLCIFQISIFIDPQYMLIVTQIKLQSKHTIYFLNIAMTAEVVTLS